MSRLCPLLVLEGQLVLFKGGMMIGATAIVVPIDVTMTAIMEGVIVTGIRAVVETEIIVAATVAVDTATGTIVSLHELGVPATARKK